MIVTTGTNGRLGNQIIRSLALSIVAEKFNLKVEYHNNKLIARLGIALFSGDNDYNDTRSLNDEKYFTMYEADTINYNLDPNVAYFQTRDVSKFLYNYLHTAPIKQRIIDHNPYKERYSANNDLFVHLRLDDVSRFSPGENYYINAIKGVQCDNIFISTDEETNPIVQKLLEVYPHIQVTKYDEIGTFQFASTCKHVILSHGSFSAVIGYLSFFSTVYYPEYEQHKMWYGDMFSIDKWNKCSVA